MKWESKNKLNKTSSLKRKHLLQLKSGNQKGNYIPSLFLDGLKIINQIQMLKKLLDRNKKKKQLQELKEIQNLVGEVVSFQYDSEDSPNPNVLLMNVVKDIQNPDEVKYLEGINIKYSLLPLPKIKNYIEKHENNLMEAYLEMKEDFPIVKEWYRKYKFDKVTNLQTN